MNQQNIPPDDVEDLIKVRLQLQKWIDKRKDILSPARMCIILAVEASRIAFEHALDNETAINILNAGVSIGYKSVKEDTTL